MFLTTGLIIGLMTAFMFIVLVEKFPRWLKELVYGHYLASDLAFTFLALGLLPVTGALTLLAIATMTVVFTLYLGLRRQTHSWRRIACQRGRFQIQCSRSRKARNA